LAEGLEGLLEQLLDVFGIGDVGLDGEVSASSAGDLVDHFFGFGCVAGEVDGDTESVGGEAKSEGASKYREMRRLR
jgi:hypothetical protein